jgi:predicted Fe-Mo cluster-binding NifX family protein
MSEERIIVVAAEDACGFDGEVSAHFGRCPFFLLAEANGTRATVSEVVPNPYRDSHRPGAVPRFIRDMGADVIIAGGMGPRAIEMFHDFGIDVATGATGAVTTVLGAYLRGEHQGVARCAHDHPSSCHEHSPRRRGGHHGQDRR